MSDQPSEELAKSIEWFKALPTERQTYLVTQLFKDASRLAGEESEKIFNIVAYIMSSLITEERDAISKRLVQWGIDETLAAVLTERVVKMRPTTTMDAEALRALSDDVFTQLINAILVDFYGDWANWKHEEAAAKIGVKVGLVHAALRLLRDTVVWDHLRGHVSLQRIEERFLEEYKYPPSKVKILAKAVQERAPSLRADLAFGQLQDIEREVKQLREATSETLSTLKELLRMIREAQRKGPGYVG